MTQARPLAERCVRGLTLFTFRAWDALLRRPRRVLALTLALSVAANVLIERMPRYFTMEDTLDPHLPSVVASRRLEQDFSAGQSLYILFGRADGAPLGATQLCAVSAWLAQGVYAVAPHAPIIAVVSPFSLVRPSAADGKLWFPKILKPVCDREDPPPASGFARDGREVAARLVGTPWEGLFAAADGHDLLAEVVFRGDLVGGGSRFPASTLFEVDASLHTAFRADPAVSWRFFGPAAFRGYAKAATDADLRVNAAIPLILGLLFRLFYGSWMGGLLLALGIVLMRSFLLGTMALMGFAADPLSGSLILLVSLAAIEDFLFVTTYQLHTGCGWRACYRRFLIPSFLTSVTTMLGFASLAVAPIKTVRDLGLWAAYGALVQWVVSYFLVPCLQAVWPRSQVWTAPAAGRLARAVQSLGAQRLPRWCRRLVLPLLVAGVVAIPNLRQEDALNRFFPADHPYNQAAAALRVSRGWEGVVAVVIGAAASPDQAQALLAGLERLPGVVRLERGADLSAYLRRGLAPLTADLVERLASVDSAYRGFFSAAHAERVNVYLADSSVSRTAAVIALVEEVCPPPRCYVGGALPLFVDFSRAVVRSFFESFATSLGIVCLFLAVYARRKGQRRVWPILVSAVWGPLVAALLMAVLRVPVNFVSCFFACVLVGVSGDNAVHYLYAAGRRPLAAGIAARAPGSIEITICMIGVTLLFLASAFAPPRTLGIILAIGLAVNLVGDLWVLRLLLGSVDKGEERSVHQGAAP